MQQPTCTIANCVKPPRSGRNPLCEMHYYRIRRHGDPLAVRSATGRSATSNGYALVHRPGHPLARTIGWVLEHRAVLFDRIGPGWHRCHWCDMRVAWHKQYPRDLDGLVVDHLDADKTNNVLSNLVPACNPCNMNRVRAAA